MKINIKNIDNFIFDMDGTLYRLDGIDGTIHGSTLIQKIEEKSVDYICKKENCTLEVAIEIYEIAKKNEVGPSVYFSEKYKITREEFFNEVWDINPENIVQDFEEMVEFVLKLSKLNKNLILLTAAPKKWKENVLKFLGLENIFKEEFSGEMFNHKREVFEDISKRFIPKKTISIGDQLETDIKPAEEFGLKTLWRK